MKKGIKKVLMLMLLISLMSLISACGDSDSVNGDDGNGKAKKIKIGIGLTEDHPQYKGIERFKEVVEEKTDNGITVELYPNGQLGGDREMIQAVQAGTQEVTVPSTAPLANFVPEFNVLNFPFLFPDLETADQILDGEIGDKLLETLENKDMVGLGFWEEGFYNVTNDKRPIESVEDFDGLKIRTMENGILIDAYKELGANPTPMSLGEVYTALQQGTVNGQTNPLSQVYSSNFYEVQDYVSSTHEFYGTWPFLMNKDFYDSLTEEEQAIVTEAEKEARDYQRKLSREDEEGYLEKLEDEGMKYNEVKPEEMQKMKEKVQSVLDENAEEVPGDITQELFDAVEKIEKNN